MSTTETEPAPVKRGPGRPKRGTKHGFTVALRDDEWEMWQRKIAASGGKLAETLRQAMATFQEEPGEAQDAPECETPAPAGPSRLDELFDDLEALLATMTGKVNDARPF